MQNTENSNQETLAAQMDSLKAQLNAKEVAISKLIKQRNEYYRQYLTAVEGATARKPRLVSQHYLSKISKKIKILKDENLLRKSSLFDRAHYLSAYPDVVHSGLTPERHYLTHGWKEGRKPSLDFDATEYLMAHPEAAVAGENPLVHCIKNRKRGEISNSIMEDPIFAIPNFDWALEIPFSFTRPQTALPGKIAVMLHVYYTDMLAEIMQYLANIPWPFDLLITTDTERKKENIGLQLSDWNRGKLEIKIFENRGRDIAPKLIAWKEYYKAYDFCLHLHTKKSPQSVELKDWRKYLLDNLLGSENTVRSLFEAFHQAPQLGIVAPQHFLPIRNWIGWGSNFQSAASLASRMNLQIDKEGPVDFPSGSIFWMRTKALQPLLAVDLKAEDFPEENGQLDETLAHAIERLYFFACEKAGYTWIKVLDPTTTTVQQRMVQAESPHKVSELIQLLKVDLLKNEVAMHSADHNSAEMDGSKRFYYLQVQENSPYKELAPEVFAEEIHKYLKGEKSRIAFDEKFYLQANPDVKRWVLAKVYECGFIHFCLSGYAERRAWSDRALKEKFNLLNRYPEGAFAPQRIPLPSNFAGIIFPQVLSEEPFLLIVFSHLQKELFYAGYSSFFKDFLPIFDSFTRIVMAVESAYFEAELAQNYCQRIEVMALHSIKDISYSPTLVMCFNHHHVNQINKLYPWPERIVYYCQDFEAGFFPFSKDYIDAERALVQSRNIILSTEMLKNYLEQGGYLASKNIFVTTPSIDVLEVSDQKSNKIFFYFRPEGFNSRNIAEIIWEAVHEFCTRNRGYELYLVGTVETYFSMELSNNKIYVLGKLPKEEYQQLLTTCDAVIAMIYSAHPGVIAYQAAASGIPTITNVFRNRNAQQLKNISSNILPFDPVREDLSLTIEEALTMPKGVKHFNPLLYGSINHNCDSLKDYILEIGKD